MQEVVSNEMSNHGEKTKTISHAINFTYGPIVQCECETPFEKNTFVDDGVQTITNKL